MEMWTEIRRKVLVDGASKRSIRRDYRVSARTLEKILANAEPPGYRQRTTRPKPMLGQFLPVIDEILESDKTAPPKQRHTAKRTQPQHRFSWASRTMSSTSSSDMGGRPGPRVDRQRHRGSNRERAAMIARSTGR
jgi:hypothetical protein